MCGDGGNKILGSRSGGLNVLRADFEDFFEVDTHINELALQEYDDIFVMLALLLRAAPRVLRLLGFL